MDITLEQSLASAIRYIQDNTVEGTKYYFGEIPEDYEVPSIYFQPPYTTGSKATLRSYRTRMTLNIWFMESSTWDAKKKALDMMERIMLDECKFPLVKPSGEKSEFGLRVTEPDVRKIENGIVQLTFSFDTYFHPEKDTQKIQKFYVEMQRKNS